MHFKILAFTAVAGFSCNLSYANVLGQGPGILIAQAATAPQAVTDFQPQFLKGDDRVIAPPKLAALAAGAPSAFKFEDAPMVDVVHIVLRDLLKVDYVLHPPITGTVTLATKGEVSPDQAVALLESALQANGLVLARDTRGTYHVGRAEAIKGIVPAVRQVGTGPLPPGSGAIIVPLRFIGAAEMATILRPLMPPEALLRVDNVRNLLVLAGNRLQAEGWLDMVSTFDVDLFKGMSVGVFPLKYASVREIESALRLATSRPSAADASAAGRGPATAGTAGVQPAAGAGAAASQATSRAAASAEAEAVVLGGVRILPIERINSVMVVTPRAASLDAARAWIERIDQPNANSTEPQLYVYPVQNGSASHLASVLTGIFGGQGGAAPAASAGTGVAPALASGSGSTGGFNLQGGASAMRPAGATGGAASQPGVTSLTLPQGARVIADGINNAVLVYGTRSEFAKIEATLKRLDVPPTQVLIEASIIEVTLSDDLKYGLQWVFADKARGGLTGTGVLSTTASAPLAGTVAGVTLGAATAGFSYTLANAAGGVRALLSALADKSLVKVISSPSLMVLDNHTASIAVGNQQPIQSGTTITSGAVISNSIQYKDTGVNLSVTPSVTSGNLVTMQINQAVTDVGQIDTATGQRAFLQRQINSKVAVRSGETLVLGGLIRDNTTTGKTGLPVLQDIPIFGNLFGASSKNVARTELLVVITPRVVRSDIDSREVSSELRERMKSFSSMEPAR